MHGRGRFFAIMAIQDYTGPPTTLQLGLDADMADLLPHHQQEGKSTSSMSNLTGVSARINGPNAASALYKLPNELLDRILKHLVHESPKLLPFNDRASLSTESFASAPPHIPEDIMYLRKFVRHHFLTSSLILVRPTLTSPSSSEEFVQGFSMRAEVPCLLVRTFDSHQTASREYARLHNTQIHWWHGRYEKCLIWYTIFTQKV